MKKHNVFWISVDSLRRDFLSIYHPGNGRHTYLDELAEQGCIFENAFPGGNWTMPSHATMLTGSDVTSHMIWRWNHRFAEGTQTAFDIFHNAGYTTGCFAIPQLSDLFSGRPIDHAGLSNSPNLLKCLTSPDPFFAFWHTYKVHYPYGIEPPKDYSDAETDYDLGGRSLNYIRHLIINGQTEIIIDSYRREIQEVARFVRAVVSKLKKLGRFEDTYFIITADHGEAWQIDRTFHCNFREEVLRVPLAISGPGIRPSRVSSIVSLASLLPTVLELCGFEDARYAESFDGESLLPKMDCRPDDERPVVVGGPNGARSNHPYLAVRQGEWMLVKALNHYMESFHRIGENGVSPDLLSRPIPDAGRKMLEEFRSIAERHAERLLSRRSSVVELTRETEKKLQALGYV